MTKIIFSIYNPETNCGQVRLNIKIHISFNCQNYESDSYTYRNGKQLLAISQKTQKTVTGYLREVTIYECSSCVGCPYKKDCIKGNNYKTTFENRNKKLSVSRKMEEK